MIIAILLFPFIITGIPWYFISKEEKNTMHWRLIDGDKTAGWISMLFWPWLLLHNVKPK